jgi:hypothetical protein
VAGVAVADSQIVLAYKSFTCGTESEGRRTEHEGLERCPGVRLTQDQYLKFLDWTGRQSRKDKVTAIPKECGATIVRLDGNGEDCVDVVLQEPSPV